MGMCGSSSKPVRPKIERHSILHQSSSSLLRFERRAEVQIKVQPGMNQVLEEERLTIRLTEPVIAFSLQYPADLKRVWASACVMPGLDPRGGFKACQDLVFIESYEGVLLAGEFDGHGQEGEPVVSFCKRFSLSYLKANASKAHTDPAQFLIGLNEDCDKALKKAVDCKGSGSTAVMMVYADGVLTFSCVGDSRAVLATTDPHRGFTQPPRREDKELLDEIKSRRQVAPGQALTAEQVTQDQKPEDPGELKRIKQAGGCVMRLEDDHGRKIGPYRVWKVEGAYPGIAMSRSLGDTVAHQIGVISTPAITAHIESPEHDCFIVLASDGVWDVMENQEVCDFVEAFRNKSVRDVSVPRTSEVVCPDNVTIAQLLCEEARARWLSIVAAEDVLIDDISCVIVELQILTERKRGMPQRPEVPAPVREVEDVPGLEEAVKKGVIRPNDPRRNSTAATEMPPVPTEVQAEPERKAVVKDPRRSSIASS